MAPISSIPPAMRRARELARSAQVLCVDDAPMVRALLCLAFAEWPNVEILGDPEEALELALRREREGRPFEAIVLDIVMEPMDGLSLGARLRMRSAYAHVPLVFLTAAADNPASVAAVHRLGASIVDKGPRTGRELEEILVGTLSLSAAPTGT